MDRLNSKLDIAIMGISEPDSSEEIQIAAWRHRDGKQERKVRRHERQGEKIQIV